MIPGANSFIRRYKLLFTLPPTLRTLEYLAVVSMAFLLVPLLLDASTRGAFRGILLATAVFSTTVLADYVSTFKTKLNSIFDFRRTAYLSLIACTIWFITVVGGALLELAHGIPMIKAIVLGFLLALAIRLIVFLSCSSLNVGALALATGVQPALCLAALVAILNLTWQPHATQLALATLLTIAACYGYIKSIEVRCRQLRCNPIRLFQAFLANWARGEKTDLERELERRSVERSLSADLLRLRGGADIVLAISGVHPGPFRNVGGANFPFLLQCNLQRSLKANVVVMHGICNHTDDLPSEAVVKSALAAILRQVSERPTSSGAKSADAFVVEIGHSRAICQSLGPCYLLLLSMTGKSVEDLPKSIGERLHALAQRFGRAIIVVDCHNSLQGPPATDDDFEDLMTAAIKSLELASKAKRGLLEAGVAQESLPLGPEEGLGPGGITVLVTRVKRPFAYIIVDGNNLAPGLREEILGELRKFGLNGEVLTTDTHVVNAVITIDRGYRTVGEVGREYILRAAVRTALKAFKRTTKVTNIEYHRVSFSAKVLGNSISYFAQAMELALKHAKRHLSILALTFTVNALILASPPFDLSHLLSLLQWIRVNPWLV